MRRPLPVVLMTAALSALVLGTSAGSGHAAPPGDPGPEALSRFEALADREGYSIVDPVCVEADADRTFVCYALVDSGEAFIARTVVDGDVDEWEIIERPGDATGSSDSTAASVPASTVEPNDPPAVIEPAEFDALTFFAALFSADIGQVAKAAASTQPGSPAEAYARFQVQHLATTAAAGVDVDRAYVYLTTDGIRVCLDGGDDCFEFADLEVAGSQLVSFTIDGNDIGPRLAGPGLPTIVGGAAAQLLAGYQTVSGDQLSTYVEVLSADADVFELSTAVYVSADGTQTPVDRDASLGAVDGEVKGATTVLLAFPGAAPGGEIRILVRPHEGGAPLVAEVPVVAIDG